LEVGEFEVVLLLDESKEGALREIGLLISCYFNKL